MCFATEENLRAGSEVITAIFLKVVLKYTSKLGEYRDLQGKYENKG